MDFLKLLPKSTKHSGEYLGDKVRVSFPNITLTDKKGNKTYRRKMILFIGKDKAKQFGFKKGDRVCLYVSKDTNLVWRIIKNPEGWTLCEQGTNLKLDISWNYDVPNNITGTKFVTVVQNDGEMELLLPGAREKLAEIDSIEYKEGD